MGYRGNEEDRRIARKAMEETDNVGREMPIEGRHMDKMDYNGKNGSLRNRVNKVDESRIEELYVMIGERMCMALDFHNQLADYFCFLGLHGFKRMCEYQYMKESKEMRKVHRRYIDMHNKVLPINDAKGPSIIPRDWTKYTTHDIDDSVIPKFVRMALKEWYEWEKETKELYEDICKQFMEMGLYADYDYVETLIVDLEKECKKIMHLYEKLNGTGYDVNTIHGIQDKYHEKYKKKYEDKFTTKNNYVPWDIPEGRTKRTRRIGYV